MGDRVVIDGAEVSLSSQIDGSETSLSRNIDGGEIGESFVPLPQISIGEVETLEPNEEATATMTGTASRPVLNLGLVKGQKGDKGDKGDAGSLDSVSATVDATVGTPSVDVVYDGANAQFNFHNLKGIQGERGPQGETGPQGPQGDPATNLVQSVNGKQGTVVLGASDVGALPSNTTYVSSVNGQSGAVTVADEIFVAEYGVTTFAEVKAAIDSGKTVLAKGMELSNYQTFLVQEVFNSSITFGSCGYPSDIDCNIILTVDVNDTWSTTYRRLVPTSRTINNKPLTGNIFLIASDVGALPSSTSIPTKVSDLTNDSGFIDSSTAEDVALTTAHQVLETYATDAKHLAIIYVNGSQAALVDLGSNPIGFQDFYTEYTQNWTVLVGSFIGSEYELRVWEGVYSNALTQEVTLASVDDSMVYFVHLQDSGSGLVGSYSTVTIPTKVSDLTNDSGYLTLSTLPIWNGGVV